MTVKRIEKLKTPKFLQQIESTLSIYLTHHREDLYPQPDKFEPDRFINRKYSSYEFCPFGGGSRQCLGQVFALFEMKLILATILLNYKLKLEELAPVIPARRIFGYFFIWKSLSSVTCNVNGADFT